jgi:hypothetical protein
MGILSDPDRPNRSSQGESRLNVRPLILRQTRRLRILRMPEVHDKRRKTDLEVTTERRSSARGEFEAMSWFYPSETCFWLHHFHTIETIPVLPLQYS